MVERGWSKFFCIFLFGLSINVCLSTNIFAGDSAGKKYYKEGLEYFKKGEYEKSIDLCKKAIEADPKYLDAYYGMGRLYLLLDKPKESIAVFEKMLTIDPKSGDAYIGLGEVYWKKENDYQKAINAFKKALEVEPNNANNRAIYVALSGLYLELRLYNECLSTLEKAKSLASDYGDVYAVFGDYYAVLKQDDKALENYKKAIELYQKQGLADLAEKYEKILNRVGKPILKVYLKSKCVASGIMLEETSEYLVIEGDIFCPGPGDGFMMGQGGVNKYNKKDIERIEQIKE